MPLFGHPPSAGGRLPTGSPRSAVPGLVGLTPEVVALRDVPAGPVGAVERLVSAGVPRVLVAAVDSADGSAPFVRDADGAESEAGCGELGETDLARRPHHSARNNRRRTAAKVSPWIHFLFCGRFHQEEEEAELPW